MMNFTLITAVTLCSFSLMSVSGSESQTVDVQSGENVTLTCSNLSRYDSLTWWFRLVDRTKVSCITVMSSARSSATYCDGYKSWKFEMSSNTSTLSLKINNVELSDSGLYFCGFFSSGYPTFSVTRLNVRGTDLSIDYDEEGVDCKCETSDGAANLTSLILGGLTVFLLMVVVGLVVKVRKLQTAANEDQNPQHCETLDSDELRDAALSLYSTLRNRRPASEREVETHVVYAASR